MAGFLLLPGGGSAAVTVAEEAATGLLTWTWREAGVSVQLVQRLPDQTRAFFQARGFSSGNADALARACVFQTIFRNDGSQTLVYDLNEWRVTQRGIEKSLLTRERWDANWRGSDVSQAARIALRWSLLPTRQRFEPGDYNWGMTSFGLPPGETFDLSLVTRLGGDAVAAVIPAVVCPADLPGS